jgi:hypothetical protein
MLKEDELRKRATALVIANSGDLDRSLAAGSQGDAAITIVNGAWYIINELTCGWYIVALNRCRCFKACHTCPRSGTVRHRFLFEND